MCGDTEHPHAQRVADPFHTLWVPILLISPPYFAISSFLVFKACWSPFVNLLFWLDPGKSFEFLRGIVGLEKKLILALVIRFHSRVRNAWQKHVRPVHLIKYSQIILYIFVELIGVIMFVSDEHCHEIPVVRKADMWRGYLESAIGVVSRNILVGITLRYYK